jgi:hypothetical protein
MSTLQVAAAPAPKLRPIFGGFTRLASAVGTVIHVFAEAQRQAEQAQRRSAFIAR